MGSDPTGEVTIPRGRSGFLMHVNFNPKGLRGPYAQLATESRAISSASATEVASGDVPQSRAGQRLLPAGHDAGRCVAISFRNRIPVRNRRHA